MMSKVNKRRILISGGAGFLGYHLALNLSQDPSNHLVLVDNFTRGRRDEELKSLIQKPNVRILSYDLTDKAAYKKIGSNYDEVYHLAAIIGVSNVSGHPHEVLRVNAVSTLNLLEWFVKDGAKKFLFASTSEAYAWTQNFYPIPIPTPEDVPLSLVDLANPRSSYAGSKIFGELAVTQYCDIYKKPFTILRYHNMYGPRMGGEHVIPELYLRAARGQDPLVVYSADHSRTFCYISDAVSATISAMQAESANGQTLNIGSDEEEITMGELARSILKKAKIEADIMPRPAVNDPIVRRCPDISKARRLLGYKPRVRLNEGLGITLAWYEKMNKRRGETWKKTP